MQQCSCYYFCRLSTHRTYPQASQHVPRSAAAAAAAAAVPAHTFPCFLKSPYVLLTWRRCPCHCRLPAVRRNDWTAGGDSRHAHAQGAHGAQGGRLHRDAGRVRVHVRRTVGVVGVGTVCQIHEHARWRGKTLLVWRHGGCGGTAGVVGRMRMSAPGVVQEEGVRSSKRPVSTEVDRLCGKTD
eukprot:364270-Chlamydomonas_euryale.AAC.11